MRWIQNKTRWILPLILVMLIATEITMPAPVSRASREICYKCHGHKVIKCTHCNGVGHYYDALGVYHMCTWCFGDGKMTCYVCGGKGYLDSSSGGSGSSAPKPYLSETSLSLITGNSKTLKVKNAKASVRWSSSKPSVAIVNNKGKVTAKTAGSCVIYAQVSGKKLKCKVKVIKRVALTGIRLSDEQLNLIEGDKKQFACEVTPDADKINVPYSLSWKSADTSVAMVSSKGVVKAVSPGVTQITCTDGSVSANCRVSVFNAVEHFVDVMKSTGTEIASGKYKRDFVNEEGNKSSFTYDANSGEVYFYADTRNEASVTYEASARFKLDSPGIYLTLTFYMYSSDPPEYDVYATAVKKDLLDVSSQYEWQKTPASRDEADSFADSWIYDAKRKWDEDLEQYYDMTIDHLFR